jgi:AAA15 family ATPase/GTPase
MLKLFEVTGFKNFENTVRLDFSDVRDYNFNDACVSNGLLQKMIVYGKNSVGKSNLGLALFDIVSHLTSNNVGLELYNYYLNVQNKTGYAEFHYVFIFGESEIEYIYRKNEKQTLVYETVFIDGKLLYNYDYEDNYGDLSGLKTLTTTLNMSFRGSDSILKYAIVNTALSDDHPLYQLHRYVSHMLWYRNLGQNRYVGYKADNKDYFDFIFEGDRVNEFETFIHEAGVKENLVTKKDFDGNMRLYFDSNNPLPFFQVASSGTKALYTFFYWLKTATDVSLMFIDEFDAFYHFELAETLVDLLEQIPGLQVILTSHNTNLLSNRIMRPDCYFILTSERLTSLANATKRELREGHNLEKLYISGEFDD